MVMVRASVLVVPGNNVSEANDFTIVSCPAGTCTTTVLGGQLVPGPLVGGETTHPLVKAPVTLGVARKLKAKEAPGFRVAPPLPAVQVSVKPEMLQLIDPVLGAVVTFTVDG